MVGWHHRLTGHEFEQALGDSEGHGSLACYSPQGHKTLDMTERLKNNNNKNTVSRRGVQCSVTYVIKYLVGKTVQLYHQIFHQKMVRKLDKSIFICVTELYNINVKNEQETMQAKQIKGSRVSKECFVFFSPRMMKF